jgi:predicted AAA+ superfamily ATPase
MGALFEGWVVSLLRAYRDYRGLFDEWFYWAPGKGSSVETDLLLRRGRDLVAIEVKSGRRVGETEMRGLRAVGELRQVKRRLVVYRGERRLETADGIEILPVEAFLREVESGALLP